MFLPEYLDGPIHLVFSQSLTIRPHNPKPNTRQAYTESTPSWWTPATLVRVTSPKTSQK